MVRLGEITEEQAQAHPGKNLITRAVGTDSSVSGDVFFPEMKKGEYILLCSDGLSNLVSEQEILYEVMHGGENSDCCERLIDILVNYLITDMKYSRLSEPEVWRLFIKLFAIASTDMLRSRFLRMNMQRMRNSEVVFVQKVMR